MEEKKDLERKTDEEFYKIKCDVQYCWYYGMRIECYYKLDFPKCLDYKYFKEYSPKDIQKS